MVVALAITFLSLSSQAPPEELYFQGHAPLPNSSVASFARTERWLYSFQGDWDEVVARAKEELMPLGYKEDAHRIEDLQRSLKEDPSEKSWGKYWLANSICFRRGGFIAISITILEDGVTLVRDCRLERAKDWPQMGPNKRKDKGWITVIVARPRNDR